MYVIEIQNLFSKWKSYMPTLHSVKSGFVSSYVYNVRTDDHKLPWFE